MDSSGSPVIDPTVNVMNLVEAATLRLDDLRDAENRRVDERFRNQKEYMHEIQGLIAAYEEKLRVAEANRIDAIRAVDVGAVATAAERASQQAQVLATQVATSAETLRTLVATSAATTAAALTQIINPITERLAQLEKAQYEGAGRAVISDPITQELLREVKSLGSSHAQTAGGSELIRWLVPILMTVIGVTIAAVALMTR